jgi:hypothetical protein
MLVLFDNGTPRTLARYLIGRHTVTEARARGWDRLENGELLDAAETAGFDVLVTTDKNLSYQQNREGRRVTAAEVLTPCRGKRLSICCLSLESKNRRRINE